MLSRSAKPVLYLLEALNSLATSYYFYYLFFYTRDFFHFSSAANLGVCSLHGLVYAASTRVGGNYGQRAGPLKALRLGFGVMFSMLLWGSLIPEKHVQLLVLMGWTFGMSFTWPVLAGAVCQNESSARLPKLVGIYNLVWAGISGLSYFFGGAVFQALGPQSIFFLPMAIHLVQLLLVAFLQRFPEASQHVQSTAAPEDAGRAWPRSAAAAPELQQFLTLARLANPFAYMAINAAIPVMPYLAAKFHLSVAEAGIFGSVWFFGRLLAFLMLWGWQAWHYDYPLLLAAMLTMIAAFASILLLNSLVLVVAAQLVFGLAIGLIYYSSLYYSMHAGETKAAHGGLHESAIGAGICSGSAVGALSGLFFPGVLGASVWPVTGLLLAGCGALVWVRAGQRNPMVAADVRRL